MAIPITADALAQAHGLSQPRWSPSGRRFGWLDSFDGESRVIVVDSGRGPATAAAVTPAEGLARDASWCWLDDENVVLATRAGEIVVADAASGDRRTLYEGGTVHGPTVSVAGAIAWVVEADDACSILVLDATGDITGPVGDGDYSWDPAWSPDGARLVWHSWDLPAMPWDMSRVVRDDGPIAHPGDDAISQPRFSPDGEWLGFVSDRSGWANLWIARPDGSAARPVLPEPREHAEPTWGPGQRSWAWSPDGRSIALCRNEDGFGRLVIVELASGDARDVGRGWHRGLDWGPGGLLAVRSGARTTPQIVCIDPDTGEREIAASDGLDREALVEPAIVRITAGAVDVPALLFRPSAAPADGPLVVSVHGGPTDQARADWDPRQAYLLARGFAVLRPNARGSTGYGRDYARALAGAWGVDDVDDIVAAVRHAVAEGWARPRSIALMGGSSGGLAALIAATQLPDLVGAVIDRYGVSDLAQLDAVTHRFESGYTGWLAGPRSGWAERSPITRATSIRVPTLVLQGSDDEVVPRAQSDELVAAMRAAGAEVAYVVYDGEGHGFRRVDTMIDELHRVDDFLRRHLLTP